MAAFNDLLDLVSTIGGPPAPFYLFLHLVTTDLFDAISCFAAFIVVAFVLIRDKFFAVGDGDLIVVWMDFVKGQESVTVAAILHECGLQGWFYPGDFRQVDVAFELFFGSRFVVKIFESVAVHDHHPSFFRMGSVDKHSF